MLNEQSLRAIFEKEYNRSDWYRVLRLNFYVETLREPAGDITSRIKTNPYNAKAFELGNFETPNGQLIGLYEVHSQGAKLQRNRRALRDLLGDIYRNDVEAALVVFVQESKWRFTYVSEIAERDSNGKRIVKSTDPKRYTYLFGVGEKALTAARQFSRINSREDLFSKGITLEALLEAFNVEKMSKAFFDEYRKHYGAFTAYITGEDEKSKVVGKASPFLNSTFGGNSDESKKEARDFVKKMLGRIVFLYFLEKKGWLGVAVDKKWGEGDENFLSNLFAKSKDKDAFYSNVLAPLFFGALNTKRKDDIFITATGNKVKIPFLNGGLFEEDETNTQLLVFPKKLFADLFEFFDKFNFTVYEDSPDEHTVAVDPEMLGHIFENLLEDNKDKGAYYTPKEIVHYMCQESLIEYLYTKLNPTIIYSFQELGKSQTDMFGNNGKKGQLELVQKHKTPKEVVRREALEAFIKQGVTGPVLDHEEAILNALYKVKVCDPAIGSGAFPMGVLMEIFHAVETLFEASAAVTKKVWNLKGSDWVNNRAAVKTAIIQNSIYGVDIEQGAVDIARLRFWLSLVVDEEVPQPLPNLDYKIVAGNSLLSKFGNVVIDIDWNPKGVTDEKATRLITEQQIKLHLLQERQHIFFIAQHGNKQKLKEEIRNLKVEILANQLELTLNQYKKANSFTNTMYPTAKEQLQNQQIRQQTTDYKNALERLRTLRKAKNETLEFFDWKLEFPEVMNEKISKDSGYDIVIGNPPYVGEKGHSEIFEDLKKVPKWDQFYRRRSNTYYFFIKMGMDLLKNNGIQSLIIPREFMSADWANKVRKVIIENSSILEIIDFEKSKVFKEAGTSSLILIHKKFEVPKSFFKLKSFSNEFSSNQNELDKQMFSLIDSSKITTEGHGPWCLDNFKIEVSKRIVQLSEFFEISQGIVTGADKVTPKHIEEGLIEHQYLNRGIFILKEGIDIQKCNGKVQLKIKDKWIKLDDGGERLIKPYLKTENLKKWSTNETKTYLIYFGKERITRLIETYLMQFVNILINRATTVDDRTISFSEFKTFSKDDIKAVYSPAGAVQSIMKNRKWYLPFYERVDVPFELDKIIVNTKNMEPFTYTKEPAYLSGGGSGGQNFIYPKKDKFNNNNDISNYTIFINAILNSKLIRHFVRTRQYNQLSTSKTAELPIPSFETVDKVLFSQVLSKAKELIYLFGTKGKEKENIVYRIEREIDSIVYKIYDISYYEASLIENTEVWMSEEEYNNFYVEGQTQLG